MKAKYITNEPDFKPVILELTFETEKELVFFRTFLGKQNNISAGKIAGIPVPGYMLWDIYKAIPEIE